MVNNLRPGDPLRNVPDHQRELFARLTKICGEGFSVEDVNGAAANLIVNGLRGIHPTRQAAEVAFDRLFGVVKQMLMNHYDSTGRKKGVFPFDQTVSVPHFDFRSGTKFNGG